MDALNSDIKSHILMEMQDTLTTEQLKQLKEALERNLYGVLFRKTLATQLYHKGVDIAMIARILGHASIKTTEKYYLTLCDTDVKYAYYKCA